MGTVAVLLLLENYIIRPVLFFLDLECSVNSFYRPHKMALWNHLVPDLVQLSVQERETEKLPRYPTLEDLGNSHDKNSGIMVVDSPTDNRDVQKTPTFGHPGWPDGPEIAEVLIHLWRLEIE